MKTKHHGQMSESFLTAVFLSLSSGLLVSSNIMDGQWDRVLH